MLCVSVCLCVCMEAVPVITRQHGCGVVPRQHHNEFTAAGGTRLLQRIIDGAKHGVNAAEKVNLPETKKTHMG